MVKHICMFVAHPYGLPLTCKSHLHKHASASCTRVCTWHTHNPQRHIQACTRTHIKKETTHGLSFAQATRADVGGRCPLTLARRACGAGLLPAWLSSADPSPGAAQWPHQESLFGRRRVYDVALFAAWASVFVLEVSCFIISAFNSLLHEL